MEEAKETKTNEIIGVVLIGLAALCAVTIYFGIHSAFGDAVYSFVFGLGGVLGYMVPIFLIIAGVLTIAARHRVLKPAKLTLVLVCVLVVFSMFHLGVAQYISLPGAGYGQFLQDSYAIGSQDKAGGGVLGGLVTYWTYTFLGLAGSWIVLIVGMAVCILALTNLSIRKLSADLGTKVKSGYEAAMSHVDVMREQRRHDQRLFVDDVRTTGRQQSYVPDSDNPFDLHIQPMDGKKKPGGRKKGRKTSSEPSFMGAGFVQQPRSGKKDNIIDFSERLDAQKDRRPAHRKPHDDYNADIYRQVFADTDIQFDDNPVIEMRGKRKLNSDVIDSAPKPEPRRIVPPLVTPNADQGRTNTVAFNTDSGLLGSLTVDKDDEFGSLDTAGGYFEAVQLDKFIDENLLQNEPTLPNEAIRSLIYDDEPSMPVEDTKPNRDLGSTKLQIERVEAAPRRKVSEAPKKSNALDSAPAAPMEEQALAGGYHVTTEQNRPGTAAVLSAEADGGLPGVTQNGLPPLDLLDLPTHSQTTPMAELQASAAVLEKTLRTFKIEAHVVNILQGPVVTRFELELAKGIKVSRVVGLSDNLAMELAARTIRIEAPVPGKSVVGIEVPNNTRQMVGLRELLESDNARNVSSRIAFALGKDITGTPVIADIASMPHLLIAGQTGSGKSVCLNSLIASILFRATPEDVQMIMVDPKHVELSGYNSIPHLVSSVISDAKEAALALNWASAEQHRRYALLEEKGVRDIKSYNKLMEAQGEQKMPQLVVIVDEFAELMMGGDKEVEAAIQSIAQLGRAGGIHLVLATQRPTTDVITGRIKANVPGRIAFSVRSQIDSRTILDCQGAEKLLGKGDMLYYKTGMSGPERLQGCNVTDAEIERVVNFWKEQNGEPTGRLKFDAATTPASSSGSKEHDPCFLEAARIAAEENRMATSLLQRRLSLGYGRAAKLVDQLEEEGIISGPNGSKPRTVLLTPAEIEERYGGADSF